jgi:L-iditol 2-dehydrogenase
MNALLLRQYNKLELVDFPKPAIAPDELLVRVKACGICGSDVHGLDGSTGRRIPPLVMGHEAAGIVEEIGSAVKNLRPGDRVTFDSTISCGACFYCRRGQINLCDNRQVLGVSCGDYRRHGAFAEFVAVPERISYRLPDTLSFERAALIEAVGVAVHGVGLAPVRLGDTGVVVGTGMIGLLVVQALKLAGCGRVIAIDIDDAKLRTAAGLGADELVNSKAVDAPARVRELTDGRGADIAMEVVGATQPLQTALNCVRKGGTIVLVGNISPNVELPLQPVVTRQINLIGSCASSGEYPVCIDLLSRGAIRVDPLISAIAPLAEAPGWFQRLYGKEPNLMKVILQPS